MAKWWPFTVCVCKVRVIDMTRNRKMYLVIGFSQSFSNWQHSGIFRLFLSLYWDRKRPQISLSLLHKLHCQWMCKLFPLCFLFRLVSNAQVSAFDVCGCACVFGCNFQDAMTTFGSFHTLSATSALNCIR